MSLPPVLAIARFEIGQRLRRISTWVYVALFFGIAVLCVLASAGAIAGATVSFGTGGKIYADAPAAIHQIATLIGLFGTSFVAAIAGQATYQDIDHRVAPIFFSLPIKKSEYLLGRLLGALVVCVLIYAAIGLGMAFAFKLPWVEPSRIGAHAGAVAYVKPYLVGLLPNLLVTIAIFFSLAALTRRMMPVYTGSVILFLGYLIAVNLTNDVENKTLTSLLDPFGMLSTSRVTEYWTASEQNTRTVPLQGVLLYNRLIWGAVSLGLLAFTFVRFTFAERGAKATAAEKQSATDAPADAAAIPVRTAHLDFSTGAWVRVFASLVRLQLRETVKNVIFVVLLLAGVLFMASTAPAVGRLYGTPTWPVTYEVLELLGGTFAVFTIAIITFYSGELVWRERDARLSQIYDALPVPRGVVLASKLCALFAVDVILLFVVFLGGIVVQTLKGYHHYEIGLYARWLLLVRLPSLAFLTMFAMFVHVVVNNKYLGHFLMIGYYGVAVILPAVGFEHAMYMPNSQPAWMYSDMNRFGHYVAPLFWFRFYWTAFAVVLGVIAHLFWVRGVESSFGQRLALARQRLTMGAIMALAAGFGAFAGAGAFMYWNMDVLNKYRTKYEQDELQAKYERRYRAAYDDAGQPKVKAAKVNVEIYPSERKATIEGSYDLANETRSNIDKVFVNLPDAAKVESLTLDHGETLADYQPSLGVRIYDLKRPLKPGEHCILRFTMAYANRGFTNGKDDRSIVENGTFFGSGELPVLGYERRAELSEEDRRKKHHLPERPRMRDLDDAKGALVNYVSHDGDWINFEATVGTSADQIAIAPGYLLDQKVDGGRAHFHYKMDAPILNFYSFLSARYAVKRDETNGVAIEIYYHPGHEYDVDRMIKSIKASLEYFGREFSPYQHKQVRIIEFPRYEQFAQSFPNTIPYSESVGFIMRVDNGKADDIDMPFYVTAHEVAHQWWAHQVVGADVQGATMLSETFAQYSALMLMKHTYGERSMRKFLRYELDRYLQGRAMEHKKELPLMRVENQPYIHYSKGSLVMYALQDAIGEETVNRALHKLLEKTAFKGPPYPTTRLFMEILRQEAPRSAEPLIHDLFEVITLHELQAKSATAKALPDGRWEVTVKATAKKMYADDQGAETEAPIDEDIDFGALDADGNVIALEKRRVNAFESTVTFIVDKKPAKAGIDPIHMKIDRRPDDNVVAVQ